MSTLREVLKEMSIDLCDNTKIELERFYASGSKELEKELNSVDKDIKSFKSEKNVLIVHASKDDKGAWRIYDKLFLSYLALYVDYFEDVLDYLVIEFDTEHKWKDIAIVEKANRDTIINTWKQGLEKLKKKYKNSTGQTYPTPSGGCPLGFDLCTTNCGYCKEKDDTKCNYPCPCPEKLVGKDYDCPKDCKYYHYVEKRKVHTCDYFILSKFKEI